MPFGNYVDIKKEGSIPKYSNSIGGVLLAYDRQISDFTVGGGVGYAYDYMHISGGARGRLQDELMTIYSTYTRRNLRGNLALWGGFYQLKNTRLASIMQLAIPSKAHTHGWVLSPHLEIASPWSLARACMYVAEPFVTLDWANAWQKG